jgi:hypothetical protein
MSLRYPRNRTASTMATCCILEDYTRTVKNTEQLLHVSLRWCHLPFKSGNNTHISSSATDICRKFQLTFCQRSLRVIFFLSFYRLQHVMIHSGSIRGAQRCAKYYRRCARGRKISSYLGNQNMLS